MAGWLAGCTDSRAHTRNASASGKTRECAAHNRVCGVTINVLALVGVALFGNLICVSFAFNTSASLAT